MTKTRYSATDANGTVHTRSTERTYTHTVVVQRSKDYAITRANAHVAYSIKRAEEEFFYAAATIEAILASFRARRLHNLGADYAAERKAKGEEFVAKWGTPEAYAAAELANDLAKIEATDWSVWHNLGWCGRPDLAQKAAAKAQGPANAAVVILEAVAA